MSATEWFTPEWRAHRLLRIVEVIGFDTESGFDTTDPAEALERLVDAGLAPAPPPPDSRLIHPREDTDHVPRFAALWLSTVGRAHSSEALGRPRLNYPSDHPLSLLLRSGVALLAVDTDSPRVLLALSSGSAEAGIRTWK